MNQFVNRLRGILAILVAAGHAGAICTALPTSPDHFQAALTPLLMFSGFNYVIGFVVISGYCIARSTLNRPFDLSQYLKLRATRIYPALIVCALLAGLVEASLLGSANRIAVWSGGIDAKSFAASLLGLGGFMGVFGSYAPTYTVSFELLYYFIWGLAFATLPPRLVVIACVISLLLLFGVMPRLFHFALAIFAVWLIGAAIAMRQDAIVRLVNACPLWATWLSSVLLFIWGNSAVVVAGVDIWRFPGSLVTVPCGALFGFVLAAHLAKNGPRLALDEWLGEISYPLFLSHGPVLVAAGSAMKAINVHTNYGVAFCLLMTISLASAQVIVVLIERPVMRLRRARLKPAIS
ncbi:acyltransferase [Bradyrhizobium sediminis]|uniref:Acyltransferase n=1 Tax=Bradyrhizobium sediminis TaxID=2840469 RepID=A0A975P2T0_9BRAD|nr:acyltransferase [Bradyrhizobium sediminis]QWG25089.1 acyltransferase [Bradyrhizobium sediminis]